MRKAELTPEEKKRLLELEKQKKEFVDRSKKIYEQSVNFCKRALAYAIVKNLPKEKVE